MRAAKQRCAPFSRPRFRREPAPMRLLTMRSPSGPAPCAGRRAWTTPQTCLRLLAKQCLRSKPAVSCVDPAAAPLSAFRQTCLALSAPVVCPSRCSAIVFASRGAGRAAAEGIETIHVVGGAAAFSEAIEHGIADVLYVTRVLTDHDTDVRMSWPLAADAAYKQVAAGVS